MVNETSFNPRSPLQYFGHALMWITGWRLEGSLPEQEKYVLIFAPHTSNWDFPFAFTASRSIPMGFPHWAGKHTLFKGPFGLFLRSVGGIPVNRENPARFMRQILDEFESRDKFILGLAPEGTRRKTKYWKSGFYKIALAAKVPIVMTYLDYREKVGCMSKPFMPTGDVHADMETVRSFYAPAMGKYPQRMGDVRLRARDQA